MKIQKLDIKKSTVTLDQNQIIFWIPKATEYSIIEDIVEKTYNKFLFDIAQKTIPIEIEKISNIVGLKPKEVKIKNFKRAWGNCSSKKIISINKDLCKYNLDAIDYVCLHEICHLKYMNHSKAFWNMVENYMPNYKTIEKILN